MLLFITFLSVGVVSAVLFCLCYFSRVLCGNISTNTGKKFFCWVYRNRSDEILDTFLGVVIISIIVLCALGICGIIENSKSYYEETAIRYEEQITQFDTNYNILVNEYKSGNKNISMQVQSYNTDVSYFLTQYRREMRKENSKWTNWYICDSIKNIDISKVRYITVEDLEP